MDIFALLLTLVLTLTLGVVSARQLLGGMLYLMARGASTAPGETTSRP